jgi:hypothetical protein
MSNINIGLTCAPKGSRTPVAGVKGRCPRPLDDGSLLIFHRMKNPVVPMKSGCPRPLDDGN